MKSLEEPGEIGEPVTSCVMPGLINAIFAATGTRICKGRWAINCGVRDLQEIAID